MLAIAVRRQLTVLLALVVALGLVAVTPSGAGERDAPAPGTGMQAAAIVASDDDIRARDLDAACPSGRVPDSAFTDLGPPFTRAIECLVWYEVTQGRTATTYGTGDRVTRGQMALFLHRLLRYNLRADALPGQDAGHGFSDVPTTGELGRALNALSSDELAEVLGLDGPLVRGFADGTYRPGTGVERAQMASFIARTFEGLLTVHDGVIAQAGACVFADTDQIPPPHRDNVDTVCAFGIAEGRADGSFAPRNTVTRGQMAAFLTRTQDIFADDPFYALLPDQAVEVVDHDACDPAAADGSDRAPWCTIQAGVDAAGGATTRVLVVGSEDPYIEDVDLGAGGIEVMGVPVPSTDAGPPRFAIVEGRLAGNANGGDMLLGRMIVLPGTGTGIALHDGGEVRLTALAVAQADIGIEVEAAAAWLDAVGVEHVGVAVTLDARAGDVRGSAFVGPNHAFVVDEADALDLGAILGRDEPGLANFFEPRATIGEHAGSPAIVPSD